MQKPPFMYFVGWSHPPSSADVARAQADWERATRPSGGRAPRPVNAPCGARSCLFDEKLVQAVHRDFEEAMAAPSLPRLFPSPQRGIEGEEFGGPQPRS